MFTLSPAVLARLREQAELVMQDTVTLYELTVSRDVYGTETVASGIVGSYPCYIGGISGKEEEIVSRLRTEGQIKKHTAKCLLPHDAVISTEYVLVVSGTNREWLVVWHNADTTEQYRLHTRAILTRDDEVTAYKDRIRRNG